VENVNDRPSIEEEPSMRASRSVRRSTVLVLSTLLLAAIRPDAALAQTPVRVVTAFDEAAGQNPEGLAVDRAGTLYVGIAPLGEVWRLSPGTTQPEPFGAVSGVVPGRDFGLLGLATDTFGDVYAGVQSADPAVNGVWRFDRGTGAAARLPGTEAIGIPNGLAFDRTGTLYVADSTGAIWRVPWGGSAQRWFQDEAITGDGSLGVFIGANGIAAHNGVLTVANTERRTLLSIPVAAPDDLSVVASFPEGQNPDGLALDVRGDAFVALNTGDAIARVSPEGEVETVASGPPLDFPSSLAFGTAHGWRTTLFGVSFSVTELFGLPNGAGPSLFRLDAGVPGWPLP
jgi:sugar lactone lactonase YvrE